MKLINTGRQTKTQINEGILSDNEKKNTQAVAENYKQCWLKHCIEWVTYQSNLNKIIFKMPNDLKKHSTFQLIFIIPILGRFIEVLTVPSLLKYL